MGAISKSIALTKKLDDASIAFDFSVEAIVFMVGSNSDADTKITYDEGKQGNKIIEVDETPSAVNTAATNTFSVDKTDRSDTSVSETVYLNSDRVINTVDWTDYRAIQYDAGGARPIWIDVSDTAASIRSKIAATISAP